MDDERVSALEVKKSAERNTTLRKSVCPEEKEMVSGPALSDKELPG